MSTSEGRAPLSWFPFRCRRRREINRESSLGSVPVSLLKETSSSCRAVARCTSAAGKAPTRRQELRSSAVRLSQLPNTEGSEPPSGLLERSRLTTVRRLRSTGKPPVMALLLRLSSCSWVALESQPLTEPLRALSLRSTPISERCDESARAGSGPPKRLPCRSSSESDGRAESTSSLPLRWLSASERALSVAGSAGSVPLRLLEARSSVPRRTLEESVAGITPESWLPESVSEVSERMENN
mmetsp:Transcript_30496/g.76555  ORF Transcript_30496/g.76555 Transcript_30496/m.76555 type:complete len:241 (-) Transcript_30496:531-1253(-)